MRFWISPNQLGVRYGRIKAPQGFLNFEQWYIMISSQIPPGSQYAADDSQGRVSLPKRHSETEFGEAKHEASMVLVQVCFHWG